MTGGWVVTLDLGGGNVNVYGPMAEKDAQAFAEFMTAAVDPAVARPLKPALAEMLAWQRREIDRNDCTHGADCPAHPLATGVHNFDGWPGR